MTVNILKIEWSHHVGAVRKVSRIFSANVSVNSKPDHPPRATPGSRTFSLPGGRVFAQLSLPGGSGFRIREIFDSFERKMQELLELFQRHRRQLEKQVFLSCVISIFAKTVDVCCTLITQTIFGHFDKFSGHPRVMFANARSSIKF